MRPRTRVFPVHHHGPQIVAAIMIGIASGLIKRLCEPLGNYLSPAAGAILDWYSPVGAVAPIVIVVLMRGDCPHRQWRFLVGGAASAGAFTAMVLFDPFNGAPFPSLAELCGALAFTWIIGLGVGGGVAIALFALRDWAWGAPLVQDGLLCPQCAYDVRGLPAHRCPECGGNFLPAKMSTTAPRGWHAWRRLFQISACALAIALVVYLAYPRLLFNAMWSGTVHPGLAATYLDFRPAATAALFADQLDDADAAVRAEAAFALMRYRPWTTDVPRRLRDLAVNDPDQMVRRMATQTLGHVVPAALESIMDTLVQDEDPDVRWIALASAASFGPQTPVPPDWAIAGLIDALDDPEVKVRRFAYEHLSIVSGQSFSFTPVAPREQRLAQQAVWQQWWDSRAERPIDARE